MCFAFVELMVAELVGVQAQGIEYLEVHLALEQAEIEGAVQFAVVEHQGVVVPVVVHGGDDAGEAAEAQAYGFAAGLVGVVVQVQVEALAFEVRVMVVGVKHLQVQRFGVIGGVAVVVIIATAGGEEK